jgi:hypothetical protein
MGVDPGLGGERRQRRARILRALRKALRHFRRERGLVRFGKGGERDRACRHKGGRRGKLELKVANSCRNNEASAVELTCEMFDLSYQIHVSTLKLGQVTFLAILWAYYPLTELSNNVIGTFERGMLFNTYSVQLPLDDRGDDMKLFIHAYLRIVASDFYFGGEKGVGGASKKGSVKIRIFRKSLTQ